MFVFFKLWSTNIAFSTPPFRSYFLFNKNYMLINPHFLLALHSPSPLFISFCAEIKGECSVIHKIIVKNNTHTH